MRVWFVLVLASCLLVACGGGASPTPTPDLVATQIAVEEAAHATMTARAPTATHTATPSSTPTDTPGPSDTPLPTDTAPPEDTATPAPTAGPASPTPTHSATPTRTPTFTPTPTWTPTFTPTPTRTPTPTPTPACVLATASEFYPIWQQVRHRLGCPIGPFHTTWSAVERFERGWMYWREDEVRIYVMYDDGHWQDYPDTWHEGEPETAGLIPPAGLLEPKRGFGKVWRDHLGGPAAAVGWAVEEERGINSKVQDFAAGTMLALEGRTYVLFRDLWSWSQP